MTQRIVYATLLLIGIVSGVSWYLEHRPQPLTAAQAVAHEVTRADSVVAAKADTVVVHDTVRVTVAKVAYRSLRDTLRLTDTLAVLRTLASADTVIVRDSVAFADASRSIEAHKAVESSLRTELALALVPHPAPRLALVASALYDPLAAIPAASADVSLRIIGSLSLMVRGEQRFTPGEKPRLYAGLSVRL
jgi:hypothetical protein